MNSAPAFRQFSAVVIRFWSSWLVPAVAVLNVRHLWIDSACVVRSSAMVLSSCADLGPPFFRISLASEMSLPASCTNCTIFPARPTATSASMMSST
ncbi:hypothetical protein BKA66DRAFT_477795 [Pyrenochaeta sp. MPI-SDFR-AT-0127]|nr:hypothetical protein BKA66DRAFT_477795 [Pyrenochaeta sp. MPI-SDFR-AT-0127]